jgi:hypothetical protein
MNKLRTSTKLYKGFIVPEVAIIFKSKNNYDLMIKEADLQGIVLWNIDLDESKKISHKVFNELFPKYNELVNEKNRQIINKKSIDLENVKKEKEITIKKIVNKYLNTDNNKLEF